MVRFQDTDKIKTEKQKNTLFALYRRFNIDYFQNAF